MFRQGRGGSPGPRLPLPPPRSSKSLGGGGVTHAALAPSLFFRTLRVYLEGLVRILDLVVVRRDVFSLCFMSGECICLRPAALLSGPQRCSACL